MTVEDQSATARRPYHEPQIQRVVLVPDEAVLSSCKTGAVLPFNLFIPNTCFAGVIRCLEVGS